MQKNIRISCVLVIGFLVSLATASAQQDEAPVVATHLEGPLHVLTCNGNAQMIASIGEDGTLLVDTGYAATAEAVREKLTELGSGPVTMIVNTHGDADHVGGNAVLGKEAVILSHSATRRRMTSYFALPAADTAGAPNLTTEGKTTLRFNGDIINVLPFPGGHSPILRLWPGHPDQGKH